jgi:hypothetical protein
VGEWRKKIRLIVEPAGDWHWGVYKFVDYYAEDDAYEYRKDGPVERLAEFPTRAKARAWLREHRKDFELDA